jgi:hypothetical protein
MYTPNDVWSVLAGQSNDPEALIDVVAGLKRIDKKKGIFLILISSGHPVKEAMKSSGLRGNQTRLKRNILRELTEITNGTKNSVDEHGSDVR